MSHVIVIVQVSFKLSICDTTHLAKRKMVASAAKDVAIAYSVDPKTRHSAPDESPRIRSNPWWRFGGEDRSFVPSHISTSRSSLSSQDEDELGNENTIYGSVFSDSRAQEFYKPIEKYEGRHRFDMHATWSDDEERKLVRRASFLVLIIDITEKLTLRL